jgi:hypothetical protein
MTKANDDCGEPGDEREPGAEDEAAEEVTAVAVDAEEVLRAFVASEQVHARRSRTRTPVPSNTSFGP